MAWYDQMSSSSSFFDDEEEKRRQQQLASQGNLNSLSNPDATDEEMFNAIDAFGQQTQDMQQPTGGSIVDWVRENLSTDEPVITPMQTVRPADIPQQQTGGIAPTTPISPQQQVLQQQQRPMQQPMQQANQQAALAPGESIVQQPGQAPVAISNQAMPVAPGQVQVSPMTQQIQGTQPTPTMPGGQVVQPAAPAPVNVNVQAPAAPVVPVAQVAPAQTPMEQAGPALPADFNQQQAVAQADTASQAYGVLSDPHATQQARVSMMADASLPQSVRDDLKQQFIDNDKHQAGIVKAQETIVAAGNGDRTAQKQLSKDMEANEGSYLKMMFMSALGLKEAATAEAAKLGIGSTIQRVGTNGYATFNAAGRAISGYRVDKDGNKTPMTSEELALADIGSLKTLRTQGDQIYASELERLTKANDEKPPKDRLTPQQIEDRAQAARQSVMRSRSAGFNGGAVESTTPSAESKPAVGTGKTISERNNNPGNIVGPDGKFVKFATEEEGRAALERDLSGKIGGTSKAYKSRFGDAPTTPERLAEVWSPAAAEGNSYESTSNYGTFIAKQLGIKKTDTIPNDAATIAKVADAITMFERGQGSGTVNAPTKGTTTAPAKGSVLDNWSDQRQDETKTAYQKRIATDPGEIEDLAQSLADYSVDTKDISGLDGNVRRYAMLRAKELNPKWSQQTSKENNAIIKDFASGPASKNIDALKTSVSHLDDMKPLIMDLNNNKLRPANQIINSVKAATGDPAVTNIRIAGQVVGAEIVKVMAASGGGVGEREEMAKIFSDINSPEQLQGAIKTAQKLMVGKMDALQTRYERTGRTDWDENVIRDKHVTDMRNEIHAEREKIKKGEPLTPAPIVYKDTAKENRYLEWKKNKEKVQ